MTNPSGRHQARRRPRGVTAIVGGLAGLALAGVLGCLPVKVFIDSGIDVLPAETKIVLGVYSGAAVFLVIGAVAVFFRAVTGAVLLLIGALGALGAVVTEPLLLYPGYFTQFFTAMFRFEPDDAFVRVAATVGGPVVLLLSALPSTFRYLRYRPGEHPEMPQTHPERDHVPGSW